MSEPYLAALTPFSNSQAWCAVCHRAPSGFGWRLPKAFQWRGDTIVVDTHVRQQSHRRFCSMTCLTLFSNNFHTFNETGDPMDQSQREAQAVQSTLPKLGDYVMGIGANKVLADYSREEIEGLVHTILDTYHNTLKMLCDEDVPF